MSELDSLLAVTSSALDFEGVTAPIPSVLCPRGGNRLPVANCCHCDSFQEIVFLRHATAVSCNARGPKGRKYAQRVSDVVRAPSFCAGPLTTLATVFESLSARAPWDAIPVLTEDARPMGLVTAAALYSSRARGDSPDAPLCGVMETQLVHVQPSTSLFDAASVLFRAAASHLVVSARDGTFLGLVAEIDLVLDMPAFRASLR